MSQGWCPVGHDAELLNQSFTKNMFASYIHDWICLSPQLIRGTPHIVVHNVYTNFIKHICTLIDMHACIKWDIFNLIFILICENMFWKLFLHTTVHETDRQMEPNINIRYCSITEHLQSFIVFNSMTISYLSQPGHLSKTCYISN